MSWKGLFMKVVKNLRYRSDLLNIPWQIPARARKIDSETPKSNGGDINWSPLFSSRLLRIESIVPAYFTHGELNETIPDSI